MDEIAIVEMNNVTTTQVATSTFPQDAMASSVSSQSSPRINLPPPPNPPFTFPTRASVSAPSSLSRGTGRRHQSAIELPKISLGEGAYIPPAAIPDFRFSPSNDLSPETNGNRTRPLALPDFSFNPGTTPTADSSLLSPSFSPPSPRMTPNHIGHRRGGSEFVGGKLKSGEPITLMSTSPTKSDGGFASPTLAPPSGPRKHQRRHSHKRSGAISSHDLALILQASPSPSSRGNSAPASPAAFGEKFTFPDVQDKNIVEIPPEASEAMSSNDENVLEKPSQSLPELSSKPAARARVGFSDTLEFIPRPLSLVSTDTTSTVRPGHSLSGSISSIASITNSTNPDRDSPATLGAPSLRTRAGSRPSTAGAVLERTSSLHVAAEEAVSPKRRNSILILNDLAQSNPPTSAMSTPTKTPKRWTFFGFDSFVTTGSPTKARRASASSSENATGDIAHPVSSTDNGEVAQDLGADQFPSAVEEKKKSGKKRQKRVKTWAGSILTRKSKSRKPKARRRSQTPPIIRFVQDEEDLGDDLTESNDQLATAKVETSSSSSRPFGPGIAKHRRVNLEDESSYPMIDLDAALGPFNTPTRDPQWDAAQREGAPPKRQLHSAAGLRGFSGPGMHYHRRAESAPEMPPFEGARFSIHRFGSSSTMADVFEEDEEDDENATESAAGDSTSESQDAITGDEDERREIDDAASTPRQEHTAELTHSQSDIPVSPLTKSRMRSSSMGPQTPVKLNDGHASGTLRREAIAEEHIPFIPVRRETMFTSPFEASNLAGPSRRDMNQIESIPPDATSIIVSGPPTMPISPYAISHSSSFPSPCSPTSYDAHRISTAPSSITDDNHFHSLLMGEPGPELVRLSVEIASVTSTNSTMTREGSLTPGVRPRNMPFHEQRPASFTTTAFGRRRSSLASLSRLISSAHGERSKLSMEVPFDNEAERKSKTSKSKRLTRMMQFWKPKAPDDS